jgi:hypothetical protein
MIEQAWARELKKLDVIRLKRFESCSRQGEERKEANGILLEFRHSIWLLNPTK